MIDDMKLTTLAADNGAGLAAVQVGRKERICVSNINGKLVPLINPEIPWKSEELITAEEGCLSLPGVWVEVPRSVEIVVRYLDTDGEPQERKLKDWDARVVQHEVDHLDGKMIVDYDKDETVADYPHSDKSHCEM